MIPSQSPRQARHARRVRRVLRNQSRSPDSRSNAPPVFTSSRVIGRAESMYVCIHVVVCRALTNICTLLYSTKRVHGVWSLSLSWE